MSIASSSKGPKSQPEKTRCLARASGALGQAGDGDAQDRGEYKAYDAKGGEQDALPPVEALAFWVVEELGEFLVYLNHWQQPGEARAEAPKWSPMFRARRRDGPPEKRRSGEREAEHPPKNAEGVGADAESGDILKGTTQNAGQSLFCLAFPHAAEVTDLVAGIAVARASQCGGELRVGSRAVAGIAPRPIVPPVLFPRVPEMIEAEPIELEVPLGRPVILATCQIADMRVLQD